MEQEPIGSEPTTPSRGDARGDAPPGSRSTTISTPASTQSPTPSLHVSPAQLAAKQRAKGLATLPPRAGGVLPDDVEEIMTTKEVRANANKKKKETRGGGTSTDTYGYAKTKWFLKFCDWAGWDFNERLVLIDANKIVNRGTMRQFMLYLHATPGMTKAIAKNCLAWLTDELKSQGEKFDMEFPRGYVTNMPGIKALKDEIYNKARTCRVELCEDLQSEVATEIGDDKMLEMCEFLFDCRLHELEGVTTSNLLVNFNTLFELRATFQVVASSSSGPLAQTQCRP